MSMQRWSMTQNHTALSGKFMKGKLRPSKSDADLRLSGSHSPTAPKRINVRKDTSKFDVGSARVPFQKEYNLVLLGQASVGKSGNKKLWTFKPDIPDEICASNEIKYR